jgi:site-specific DNA-cytosine methylase
MHRLPRLQKKTWERLAHIRPGKDWRDLEGTELELGCKPRSGTYGVLRWDQAANTVTGSADVHSGTAAVADPRFQGGWHRPLTTLELAALQGFPTTIYGKPLELAGNSEKRWRERIGNAVPPQAAKAIGETILRSLMAAKNNEWLMGGEPIWVKGISNTNLYSFSYS